jgi:rhodanese-related sulfurtransferase
LRAAQSARSVADAAGVARTNLEAVLQWLDAGDSTVYRFDVRSPAEYESGRVPGFQSAPGGQLVQETDMFAPVRGARIVLADNDGTRANMTASWLAQMGWRVFVLDGLTEREFTESGSWIPPTPKIPNTPRDAVVSPLELHEWMNLDGSDRVGVFDFAPSSSYAKEHIPGAWFALRSRLGLALDAVPSATRIVLTSTDGLASRFTYSDCSALTEKPVFLLDGGTDGWIDAGLWTERTQRKYASPPIDRYRRPYEGTDAPPDAMQAYLEWEFGLVAQLNRDGTHGFRVV